MKNDIINSIKKNPAIVLTILTAYSYYCAYCYEAGYCVYYKIPNTYIDLSVVDVIKFASALLGTTFLLVFFLYDHFDGSRGFFKNTNLWKGLMEILFVSSTIGWYGIYSTIELPPTFYYYYLGATGVLCVIYVLRFFLIIKPALKSTVVTVQSVPPISPAVKKININKKAMLVYTMLLLILIPGYCTFMGYGGGSKMKMFNVIANTKTVVIKRYGDNILCKNYIEKTQSFGDSLIIIKLGADKQLHTISRELKH